MKNPAIFLKKQQCVLPNCKFGTPEIINICLVMTLDIIPRSDK
ncbi:Uncharacterized protein dnm_007290 [Desulfonema magnum]|uniref:Uncharacterized protein n=1 Tax=Desulfonema magnum TaxID=45655 RepID=A0A975BGE6_9BACT|nr:Uncharacterized protein dnm_007290 [Desulfonema magnum]